MSGISIEVDTAPVRSMLEQLAAKMTDMTPVMKTIGEIVVHQVDHAFESGTAPGGARWKESERVRKHGGQTLIDSARMRNSITNHPSAMQVVVGTNVEYAAIHQFGGQIRPKKKKALSFGGMLRSSVTMPARPFLPDQSSLDWDEITAAIQGYLA